MKQERNFDTACTVLCQFSIADADTADLYTEISRTVDMRLWFLEAHLQGSDGSATNGSSSTTKTVAQVK